MEKKNILLLKGDGVYGALRRYIDEFARAFRELGYNTIVLDENLKSFREKNQWITSHTNIWAVVDCQGITVDLLPNYCYDEKIARVHFFCDHPVYHYSRLERLESDDILLSVDRKHTEYLRKYYSKFKYTEFVPLSGTRADDLRVFDEREIDVLFTGSYWEAKPPVMAEKEPEEFADAVKWRMQHLMLEKPHLSFEEALEEVFAQFGVEVTIDEFKQILIEIDEIELYAREYFRDRVICSLLNAGIDVTVSGNGWENLHTEGIEHLHILSGGVEAARRELGNAKIVLNIMPGFKAGFQERIAAGMLSGAVVFTDVSDYLEEEFSDGQELCFYHLDQIEELPVKIRNLLKDTERCKQIAARGKECAENFHTWKHRCVKMAEQIEAYYGNKFIPDKEPGSELVIPLETLRASYMVEEVGVHFSEKLSLLNELNNSGYVQYTDANQFLTELKEWNRQLEQVCGFHFFSGDNLEVFCAYMEQKLGDKKEFEDAMKLLILSADQMICAIKQKCEAVATEELLTGISTGENQRIYDKMLARFMHEKYRGMDNPEIKPWQADFRSENRIQAYSYELITRYIENRIDIQYDSEYDMLFVLYGGKPMYFPRKSNVQQIYSMYNFCCIEQDPESPHCYLNETFEVPDGATVIDAGVAEGNFALQIIDKVKKIYLVECDKNWIEALECTFAPYMEKVVIVPKMLGNCNDEETVTIDAITGGEHIDFIKMDVEGAEADALLGAERTLAQNGDMKCVVAVYHEHGMNQRVKDIFSEKGFQVAESEGYIFYRDYSIPIWENELRHALVRAEKKGLLV